MGDDDKNTDASYSHLFCDDVSQFDEELKDTAWPLAVRTLITFD